MTQLTLDIAPTQAACCAKSNVANLTFGNNPENRLCLSCGEHWYDSRRYSRKDWDALMEAAA